MTFLCDSCRLLTGKESPTSIHSEFFPRRLYSGTESESNAYCRYDDISNLIMFYTVHCSLF